MAPLLAPPLLRWYTFGLVKADEQPDAARWIIWIRASTPRIDFEGERVPQQVLRRSGDYFLRNGKITYEHVNAENRHDASVIIGQPMSLEYPPDETLVQAFLYPLQPQAQYVWNILRSGGTLKASIGGSCAKQLGPDGTTVITQVFWTHLAITSWPVNDDTEVSLQPFAAFVKALGTASAAPLVHQDLEGAMLAKTPALQGRWQALTEVIQQQYPSLTADQAKQVAAALMVRRGEFRHAYTSQQWLPL